MRKSLFLALAIAALSLASAQTVDIGPLRSDAKCVATTSRTESLPFIGLSANADRQCLTTRLTPSTKPGEVVQRFTLDLTGMENKQPQDHRMQFVIWNHKRKISNTRRTTVTIGGAPSGGHSAQAFAVVDAAGRITGVTITNHGSGYTTAPGCSINSNGASPLSPASCQTVISGGKVTHVLVANPGKGYPPSAGSDLWVNPRAELVTTVYNSATGQPTVQRTTLLSSSMGDIKDRTRCDCSDPTADECACVPAGYASSLLSLPLNGGQCQGDMVIEIESPVELELAIAAFYVRNSPGPFDYPVIPLGQSTRVFERLNGGTVYRIGVDANGTEAAHTYLKELRVTMETPMSANWRCDGAYDKDCAARMNRLANVTLDLSGFPFYHTPPQVAIGPPRRGIASVQVTSGGSYTSRPSVSITRLTTQTVGAVQVLSGGSGYLRAPRVAFMGGGGSGATGTATVANGVVTAITVDTPGTNYNSQPDVYLYSEKEVTGIIVENAGSGYSSAFPPGVFISAPSALRADVKQARATATVDTLGQLESITVVERGWGYESTPTVWIGSRVYGVSVTDAGSGYISPPTVTFSGGSCQGSVSDIAFATATLDGSGGVASVVVDQERFQVCTGGSITVTFSAPGSGTQASGTALMTSGSGATIRAVQTRWLHDTTAIARARLNPDLSGSPRDAVLHAVMEREDECNFGGQVIRVDVIDPGSDYTSTDVMTFNSGTAAATFTVEPDGTQATATASIDGNKLVSAVTVTQPGSGYSAASPPAVAFFPLRRVHSIKITNQGSGYTATPIVFIDDNNYGEARATATIADGRVTGITVTDPGAWFTSAPAVTISALREIRSIRLLNVGSGYDPNSPPLVWINSPTGSGAKAVAEVGPNRCLTGIRVTVPGSGYMSATITIQAPPAGPGAQTASALAVFGGGSGATATAIVENGQDAEAVATVNAAGGVSGITVTKKGRTFGGENGLAVPSISLSTTDSITFSMDLNAAGVPTGRVNSKGTPTTHYGGPPTVFISPSHGITGRAFLGAGWENFLRESSTTFAFPSRVTYTPARKSFSYANLLPASSVQSYYRLDNRAPEGSWKHFPNEDFASNNAFGADNPFNALMVPVTIKVEAIPYPELYQKGAVAGSVKLGGEPMIYQVSVPRDWSRVKISYNITAGGDPKSTLSFQTMWSTSNYGYATACPANTWCAAIANPENAIYRRRSSWQSLPYNPNTLNPPLLVEVSVGDCRGSPSGELSFNLVAEVTEYATEGECNSHFDCQHNPGRSHPTPGSRVGLSANGNHALFKTCYTDARPNSLHKGICVECSGDCDCPLRQYCYFDTEPDAQGSRERWGTCQPKDPVGDILGQTCRDISSSSLVEFGQPGRNTQQYCGKVLFYNDSYVDPSRVNNRRGEYRTLLWSGFCHNHVCRECNDEGTTTCSGKRVCVDGFWQEKSGTSAQGAYAMAQAKTVKDAVSDGNAISGGVLAFVILIAVGAGLAIFFVVRSKRA